MAANKNDLVSGRPNEERESTRTAEETESGRDKTQCATSETTPQIKRWHINTTPLCCIFVSFLFFFWPTLLEIAPRLAAALRPPEYSKMAGKYDGKPN